MKKILFLDVETVSQVESYDQLNEEVATLWREKYQQIKKRSPEKYDEDDDEVFALPDMGLFAEFGKIVCISFGFLFHGDSTEEIIRVTSIYDDDERLVLEKFCRVLHKIGNAGYYLCGHNAREFDIPYIARRMIINQIKLPTILINAKKKQWESPVIDTMDLWKFGDYKHYTSLKLLCNTLGIKSPKEDIEGKDVYRVYYQERDLKRIAYYCENDVIATAQVYIRLAENRNTESLKVERVEWSDV